MDLGLVVILAVHENCGRSLLHVGKTGGAAGFFSGLREYRGPDRSQNCDYCDYDEELDKGKTSALHYLNLLWRFSGANVNDYCGGWFPKRGLGINSIGRS